MPLYIHNFELLMSNNRDELVKLLQDAPNSPVIGKLVSEVEEYYPADLNRNSEFLHGGAPVDRHVMLWPRPTRTGWMLLTDLRRSTRRTCFSNRLDA